MTVRKLPSGKWICECYPGGRDGKRVRKQFATKGEAVAYENHIMGETENKPWLGEKQDNRRLSEIIGLWYSLYGQTLASPEKLLNKLKMICHNLGDPLAIDVTPGMFTSFKKNDFRVKPSTWTASRWPRSNQKRQTSIKVIYLLSTER